MSTLTFVFLILASPVRDGSAWSITPMPSMSVCERVLADVRSHGGWGDDFPAVPDGAHCKEVKQ